MDNVDNSQGGQPLQETAHPRVVQPQELDLVEQKRGSFHYLMRRYANPARFHPELEFRFVVDGSTVFWPKKSRQLVRFQNCIKKHYKLVRIKTYVMFITRCHVPVNPDGSVYVNKACGMVPMFDSSRKKLDYLIAINNPDELISEQFGPGPRSVTPTPTSATTAAAEQPSCFPQ